MRALLVAFTWGLLYLTALTGAQELDPIDNMCIRFDHQSVVKNNTLYIDGGRQTFINTTNIGGETKQTGKITQGYSEYNYQRQSFRRLIESKSDTNLIAIDLTSSWDWKTNISENALDKDANPKTGTYPPLVSRGALYHGADADDNIYLWGGTTSYFNTSFPGFRWPLPSQYSLWSYNVVSQTWGQYDTGLNIEHRPSSGSYTEARDQSLAFFFNGQLDSGSETQTNNLGDDPKVFIEGMVVINTSNQTARNLSTKAVVGDYPRSRGRMQYIKDVGGKGILVQIGGNRKHVGNYSNQYMYGGRGANGTENVFYDDIWVLSIPSFIWTKINQGSSPRYGHTCHRVGTRTMITVGGASNMRYDEQPCDWETKGVGVLDMSDVTWGSIFHAGAPPYAVPTRVAAAIGGSGSGGATVRQPVGGFTQEGLARMFNVSWTPPPPPPPAPHSSASGKRPTTAAIIGGIIGGAVSLGLSISLTFFYRRRIHIFFTGEDLPVPEMDGMSFQEMDGKAKLEAEMMARNVCWELPAYEKPVELGSPSEHGIARGIKANDPPAWAPPVTDEGIPF
ncbi:MAG: hypothetical protein Q9217_005056 [Psora testacea]